MRFRLTLKAALATATASALACSAPALAGTTQWQSPVEVAHDVEMGAVSVDGAGGVTALVQSGSPRRILVSHAAPGGDFSEPVPFGPHCSTVPRLVGNDRGDAIGVWQEYDWGEECADTPPAVGVRIRDAGEGFGPTQTLAQAGSANVAMNSSGRAVLIWQEGFSSGKVKVAGRAPGGGFGAPTTLSGPGAAYPGAACDEGAPRTPQVAMNDRGDAVAVWSYWNTGDCQTVTGGSFLSYRPAGGSFGEPEPIPAPADSLAVSLAPDGTATLVFSRPINGDNDTATIARSPDGDYTDVESLGTRGDTQVTNNESGGALFWWVDGFGAVFQNYGAMRNPDGSLTKFRLLHAGLMMQLALDGFGNVLTTWLDPPSEGQVFHAAIVNHLILADSPPTLEPEVSSDAVAQPQGSAISDGGAAAVAYIEYPDLSVAPPPSRLMVARRAADGAAPAVQSPAADVAPAAVTTEATCDEICRVRSTLTVTESPGDGPQRTAVRRPVIAVATRWVARRGGKAVKQTVAVGPKARKRLRKLRRAGAHLTATAVVRAEDAWHNARVLRRAVSLKKLLGDG